jgi:UDP-N-acetylmuramate--alanine ligase
MNNNRLTTYNNIYLLGIGGIGMSALARYFKKLGKNVCGYDRVKSDLCIEMENEGIKIHYNADIKSIPTNTDLVIYTPAVPKDFEEFVFLQEKKELAMLKRSDILGMLTEGKHNICIAGTHGKTTITALVSHILTESEKKCNAFIGGIAKNYNSNLIINDESNFFVAEADEFDRSFLKLHPDIAIVTSIESDHLDIYGNKDEVKKSFQNFVDLLDKSEKEGLLIKKYNLAIKHYNTKTYSLDNKKADFYAENIRVGRNSYIFDIVSPKGICSNVEMFYPGLHNIENAVAAYSLATILNISDEEIKKAIASFSGVKRRFDIQINNQKYLFVDDYAHHPTEIRAAITALKHFVKGQRILGIFQPHLYTRTRDFADDFAKSLSLLDEVILLDIYPAREMPIEGISSEMLLKKCKNKIKTLSLKENLVDNIKKSQCKVIITMGAGDIDQLVPLIKTALQ